MFVNQKDWKVRKEQNKDLLREAERERLAAATSRSAAAGVGLLGKLAEWFRAPRVRARPLLAHPTLKPDIHS
jgi:hypothetical protein